MSVMLIVRITSKPGRGKELAQLIQPVPKDNEFDGCFGMEVLQNSSDQDEIIIIEYWDSIQRHKPFLSDLQAAGEIKCLSLVRPLNEHIMSKLRPVNFPFLYTLTRSPDLRQHLEQICHQ